MNVEKLKSAEKLFLSRYPEGFNDPEMQKHAKKHKVEQLTEFAHKHFSEDAFDNVEEVTEDMIRMVSKSSMVSLFEKPKFRDSVRSMTAEEKARLATGLKEVLHGDEEIGFDMLISVLEPYKLAKWTLVTVFACYYRPNSDLLFKPTTVKNVIKTIELEDLKYNSKPSYAFFKRYRAEINAMKGHVSTSLSPSNAAFSGFLMMAMEEMKGAED